jgi:hypothetical protein
VVEPAQAQESVLELVLVLVLVLVQVWSLQCQHHQ